MASYGDFRHLNAKTISDAYLLPRIDEILDRLGGAKYFFVFDLVSGFHQIPIDENDRAKTAFSTSNNHFEFLRMPFGLKNALSEFQRMIKLALMGMSEEELFAYIDDIVVFACSLREHMIKLRKLFSCVRKYVI